MSSYIPKYIKASQTGLLSEKCRKAAKKLSCCTLCPRKCRVNRLAGETGVCQIGKKALVSSWTPHFGEEPPLVGTHGSGTLFFAGCNLKCCFCQNYEISIRIEGEMADDGQLATIMLLLQKAQCHNINLVTPSHVVPQILNALEIAARNGLDLPVIYNCSGYESLETLKLLDGVIDIYMPDFKFWDSRVADRFCLAPDYPEVARHALKEMHRQVGTLETDEQGVAVSGLLVRHLVLPDYLAGTDHVMAFLAREVHPRTAVNVMSQYRPMGAVLEMSCQDSSPDSNLDSVRASGQESSRKSGLESLQKSIQVSGITRPVTPDEFKVALASARAAGLNIIR